MGHVSYTDDYLIQTLVSIARHLGHEPLRKGRPGERHMWHDETIKAAHDLKLQLPALETYRNRLGSIPDLMVKVMDQVNKSYKDKGLVTPLWLAKSEQDNHLLKEIIVRLERLEKHLGVVSK